MEAVQQQNTRMTLSLTHQARLTPSLQVLYNCRQPGSALEIPKKIESKILEAPPSLGSLKPNLSRQLSTHRHCHMAKDMLHARPYC